MRTSSFGVWTCSALGFRVEGVFGYLALRLVIWNSHGSPHVEKATSVLGYYGGVVPCGGN